MVVHRLFDQFHDLQKTDAFVQKQRYGTFVCRIINRRQAAAGLTGADRQRKSRKGLHIRLFKRQGFQSIKICTLLLKDRADRESCNFVTADYVGFTVPDEFVVGYGLDYNERYRNLPYIGVLKEEVYS